METLGKSQRRALRILSYGPLYRGAVDLMMGGKVAAPQATLASLAKRGLVRKTRTQWELTENGRAAIESAIGGDAR